MKIDVTLGGDLRHSAAHAADLVAAGVDGGFTFEGNSDVFFPLVTAATSGLDLYTNVAIAFPRSPMHLAYQAWDLQRASDGRFALGLGTQIKPHIERRYSATWDRPVGRMVDVIRATKAIWANWADGTPLAHDTDFHRFDLMTPIFVPPPMEHPPPPIWAGALGPQMTRAMARHADGVIIHPFNTGDFLAASTMPLIEDGLEAGGRYRTDLTLNVGCICSPSLTDEEYERSSQSMRGNLAFYGSTPAYRVTLDHHDLGDLQPRLREMTKTGAWDQLASLITDDVLDLLAVRGTPAECASRLHDEYGALADRMSLTTHNASVEALGQMATALRDLD
ncbi:MAG: TIGR03617 family F420-dependent LLM class oxidoreductase [Actinomycetota bacterium]